MNDTLMIDKQQIIIPRPIKFSGIAGWIFGYLTVVVDGQSESSFAARLISFQTGRDTVL